MGENQPQQPQPSPGESQIQAEEVRQQAQQVLDQLGIDTNVAVKVLIVAGVSALIGAVIDRIFELPTGTLFFSFGGLIAALNGPTYQFFKGRESLGATVMSAVAGFAGLLVWWIVTKIIGDRDLARNITYNPADSYNLFEVLITGVVVGLLSYGWFALLRRLPDKLSR